MGQPETSHSLVWQSLGSLPAGGKRERTVTGEIREAFSSRGGAGSGTHWGEERERRHLAPRRGTRHKGCRSLRARGLSGGGAGGLPKRAIQLSRGLE